MWNMFSPLYFYFIPFFTCPIRPLFFTSTPLTLTWPVFSSLHIHTLFICPCQTTADMLLPLSDTTHTHPIHPSPPGYYSWILLRSSLRPQSHSLQFWPRSLLLWAGAAAAAEAMLMSFSVHDGPHWDGAHNSFHSFLLNPQPHCY